MVQRISPSTRQLHNDDDPACKECGGAMGPMGKLPAIGLKRTIKVFSCDVGNHIAWTNN
jgi:hypothetical protein